MLKCIILDDYQNAACKMADWSKLASQVEVQALHVHVSGEPLIEALKEQDIIICMRERTPFDEALFSRLPKLKLLVTSGMRNLAIDLPAAAKHEVTVCGTSILSEPAIEHTWALLHALTRHIPEETAHFRTGGPWQATLGAGLYGKRLGLLGLGKIGSKVAVIAKAFGMEVVAWSKNLTKEKTDELGVTLAASKEELLEGSDFVSIHLVLSDRTHNLIAAPELARMKPTAYLINASRAPIVNEMDLIAALSERRIAGAGLDVFNVEPLPADHPFRFLPNVVATPHIGYVTEENYRRFFGEAIDDINAFLERAPIRVLGE